MGLREDIKEEKLRLVILGDQALFRTSLARLLASESGLEVVRECAAGEALDFLNASPVDVVLMDSTGAPERAGELITAARSAGYAGKFLLMAETSDIQSLVSTIKLGASGIFQKSEAPDRLVLAIRLVAAGAVWADQRVILSLAADSCKHPSVDRKSTGHLDDQETKVILGIMDGLTTRKIGNNLGLRESQVKNILQGLFAKTGVRKRSQLVRLALEGSLACQSLPLEWRFGANP